MKFLFLILSFTLSFKAIAAVPSEAAATNQTSATTTPAKNAEPEAAQRWKRHEILFNRETSRITTTKPNEYYLSQSNACNQTEIQLIENLKVRKKILNEWVSNAEQRELTLLNLEQRLEEKTELLTTLETKIEKLLTMYSEKKDIEVSNLVKVYENMKPKEAAKIFDDLELNDLMILIRNMKTNKISAILANMNPSKAKIITQEILTTDNDIKRFIH